MRILNVGNLNPGSRKELLAFCRDRAASGAGAFLVAMNPIKVVKARSHMEFQRIVDTADWVFPDAWGMRWAARVLHGERIPLHPGWQVMLDLLGEAEKEGSPVYLLGASPESLEAAQEEIRRRHPGLVLAGSHHGYYGREDERDIFERIAEARPRYIFVAMGERLQEEVIVRLRERWPGAVCLGVGGTVDLLAGRQPLPPEWVRRRHLEWAYRFFRQPFRIPRFRALPVFVFLVLDEKVRGRC